LEHIRTIHAVDWVHFNVARHYWCLGNPIDFVLTQGQASDIGQGQRLVELTPTGTQAFMADKSYDCDWLIDAIEQKKYDRCDSLKIELHYASSEVLGKQPFTLL
jgi:hypothetical protein